jgi:hypothetical protein
MRMLLRAKCKRHADKTLRLRHTACTGGCAQEETMATKDKDDAETADERARGRAADSAQPIPGAYQEGSVESVGGGPSGTDTGDRTGQAGSAPSVPRAAEREGHPDAFTSSEVAEQSAGAPGRPDRTRG